MLDKARKPSYPKLLYILQENKIAWAYVHFIDLSEGDALFGTLRLSLLFFGLTFVCPSIASLIVNNDQ